MSSKDRHTAYQVLVVTGWYPSVLEPSNGDFVKEQIKLLRLSGVSIDLIYADLNIAYITNGSWSEREEISFDSLGNMDVILSGPIWPKNQSWGLRHWVNRYHKFVKKTLSKTRNPGYHDIIHAHTYLGGAVANKLKKSLDLPYVITEHYTGWLDDSIKPFHRNIGKRSIEEADEIISVSPALQKEIRKITHREGRCIPNFIDIDFFRPDLSKCSPTFQYIGVGDLIIRKNWKDLIMAFAKVQKRYPKSNLVIAGDGPELDNLNALIQSLQLGSRVSLVGHLDRPALLELYQQSHVLVHTSQTETFGLSIAEGLSCGLPVIAYPNPAANFLIQNNKLGFVLKEFSTDKLEKSMIDIQTQYNLYDRVEISKHIATHYAVEVWKEKMSSIYQAILKGGRGS